MIKPISQQQTHRTGCSDPLTCVMSSLHGPMVIAHCIQVIKVVLWVSAHPVRSSPWRPVRRETPAALASLHHVRRHVHTDERELHHVLNLHSLISILKLRHLNMMKFHDDQFLQDCLDSSTCLKRFRCSMRMSGRVHRLSLMLPC